MVEDNTVFFVGSGPGDPELITIKAKRLLEEADVIIYSGSLLNPKLLQYARKDAQLYDASHLNREKIYQILRDSAKNSKIAIRFQKDGIECKVVPGITAILGAASAMNLELTLPGNTQTIIITRAEFRTPVPDREKISELAKHGATMVFYLSVHLINDIVEELLNGGVYTKETPAAIVYRATWEDQKIIKGNLGDIVKKTKESKIIKTALIIVGQVIAPKDYEFSRVYDSGFTHGYRQSKNR
jgi:precorrin-4/cobalt-precorrin-4 C11-methyltransferase